MLFTSSGPLYGLAIAIVLVAAAPHICQEVCAGPKETGHWRLLIVDPLVFGLRQWQPDLLASMRTPSDWPFPLNHVVATGVWQNWMHRWDHVNVNALSPDLYRAHWKAWSCMAAASVVQLLVLAIALSP